jgi:hypothetical protein
MCALDQEFAGVEIAAFTFSLMHAFSMSSKRAQRYSKSNCNGRCRKLIGGRIKIDWPKMRGRCGRCDADTRQSRPEAD